MLIGCGVLTMQITLIYAQSAIKNRLQVTKNLLYLLVIAEKDSIV